MTNAKLLKELICKSIKRNGDIKQRLNVDKQKTRMICKNAD